MKNLYLDLKQMIGELQEQVELISGYGIVS